MAALGDHLDRRELEVPVKSPSLGGFFLHGTPPFWGWFSCSHQPFVVSTKSGEDHNGASFERMYKCIPVEDDSYLLECARYIERNPLRAGLVTRLEDYSYSSYRFYALGETSDLVAGSPAYQVLADDDTARQKRYVEYVSAIRVQEEYAKAGLFGG